MQKKPNAARRVLSRISLNAPVILSFVALSLLSLIMDMLAGGWLSRHATGIYRAASPMTVLRLFLHPLGHSDWAHFSANMALMLIVGPPVEEKYGSARLLVMMAVTALVTGLLHILISANTLMMGASGIVFMLMMLCAFTGSGEKGKIPLTLILACAAYLGQEIASGISQSDNVAQLAHVAGGVCGIVFGFVWEQKKG